MPVGTMPVTKDGIPMTEWPLEETVASLVEYQRQHDEHFHERKYNEDQLGQGRNCQNSISKALKCFSKLLEKGDHKSERCTTEPIERELREKRIPDLLAWALVLPRVFEINLYEAYMARIHAGERKRMWQTFGYATCWHYTPVPYHQDLKSLVWFQRKHDETFFQEVRGWKRRRRLKHFLEHIQVVDGYLAAWNDEKEHIQDSPTHEAQTLLLEEDLKKLWIPDLIIYVLILAYEFEMDLSQAFRRRKEQVEREGID